MCALVLTLPAEAALWRARQAEAEPAHKGNVVSIADWVAMHEEAG